MRLLYANCSAVSLIIPSVSGVVTHYTIYYVRGLRSGTAKPFLTVYSAIRRERYKM